MPTASLLIQAIQAGQYDAVFTRLYGASQLEAQRRRYMEAIQSFTATFGEREDLRLFSTPGRTEIGGNHTDYNHGRVLAASVNLDIIAVAAPSAAARIRVQSAGYPMDTVALEDLAVRPEETNRSSSLLRGMSARFQQQGWHIGGFDAYTTSQVLKGSGLSSSAAFEVLLGTVLNHLYNNGAIHPADIAKAAQHAENVYFGKPSGLMDQMAAAIGGIITIDFENPEAPRYRSVAVDFADSGYALCIVDTGGSHADLTCEYAALHDDMLAVAQELGVLCLRQSSRCALLRALPRIRARYGDRAALRALHFFGDNERVLHQVEALERRDWNAFLQMVIASGHSSFEYLQNVFSTRNVREQGLSLALALAQEQLTGCGAWRVHGGGFGGTTLNFVPADKLTSFREEIESVFGKGSCHVLQIRPCGGIALDALA